MNLNFSTEDIKEIVKKYFEEQEEMEVTVDVLKSVIPGANYYDGSTITGVIKIYGSIQALGKKREFSKRLEAEEVQEIFKMLLEKEGYELKGLTYQYNSSTDQITGAVVTCSKELVKTNKSKR